MTALRIVSPLYDELSARLLADCSKEACAILYTQGTDTGDLLVSSAEFASDEAYESRTQCSAVLKSEYLVQVANKARRDNTGVVLCHTHPKTEGRPNFSPIDTQGEVSLAEYFNRRVPNSNHLALVVGRDGCQARGLGTNLEINVWQIGRNVQLLSATDREAFDARFDRQARAFGRQAQKILERLRVGIVGLGGTGSIVAQQLAYLGVRDFLIVDPDCLDLTNLNRVVGASIEDVGYPKVSVASRAIKFVRSDAQIESVIGDVVDSDVAQKLLSSDFIFNCTDTHASRAVLSQIAYQYLIPTIDMGVSITVKNGKVAHINGRTQMLAPQLPCLLCSQALDSEQIRREFLTPEQRAADPYVQGVHEPQPAVISLNTSMAGLAATMFLGAMTPVPVDARFQLYDGIRGTVRLTTAAADPNCIVCSPFGALAKGSSYPLPTRSSCRT